MDKFRNDVKKALNQSMSQQNFLTDIEKQQIFRRIRKNPTNFSKRKIFPTLLTGIIVAGFIFLITSITGNKLDFHKTSISSGSKEMVNTEPIYETMTDGERLHGWTLMNDSEYDGGKTSQSGLRSANFVGRATITGTLKYYDEKDKKFPLRVVFYPSQKSLDMLPVEKGSSREIMFNYFKEQELAKFVGITPGSEKNVRLLVNKYTAVYKPGTEIPDEISYLKIYKQGENETRVTGHFITMDQNNKLLLPAKLQAAYQSILLKTKTNSLEDLTPFEVFQLYYYAEEQKDYNAQYALFNDDPNQFKAYNTLEEYMDSANKSFNQTNQQSILERIKFRSKENPLLEEIVDDSHANIIINEEDGLAFGLVKNQAGVWMVKWLPLQ